MRYVFLLMLVGCSQQKEVPEPIIRSVRYVVAEDAAAATDRTFSGQVQASNQSRLSFQVSGRAQRVAVKVGDRVKAGATIAVLDPTDFELQLSEARASLTQARAQARSAESSYKRIRALYENKNASVQDLDNARAQRDSAQAMASASSQTVRRLQRQLEYATLTARADGIIREVNVETNEVISAGQPVALLQAGEQLEVSIFIPETYVNRVKRGMTVSCVVQGKTIEGTVTEIGVPGASSAAYPVAVGLAASDKAIEAGMAAEVTFRLEADSDREGVVRVPTTAVGEDRNGRFVYIVEPKGEGLGTVKRTSVQTGAIETGGIDITEGVADGQLVVTAGVSRIIDGLEVKVPEDPEAFLQ
ncbi:MAG: efflux RND transporter periplasmic adaptor subunit [Myxococcota bacterium]